MPENTIKSIKEIPQVLKEEGAQQPVICMNRKIKGKECTVVLLGETHIATEGEERAASRILPHFRHIGCEGVDVTGFIEGIFFFLVMDYIIHPLFNILIFRGKRSRKNKSSIRKAQEYDALKVTDLWPLEKGWKPSIRTRLFFLLTPILFFWSWTSFAVDSVQTVNDNGVYGLAQVVLSLLFILFMDKIPIVRSFFKHFVKFLFDYVYDLGPSRERNMMKNLDIEISQHEDAEPSMEVIVLTGMSHTIPLSRLLKNKYGFVEQTL